MCCCCNNLETAVVQDRVRDYFLLGDAQGHKSVKLYFSFVATLVSVLLDVEN